MRARAALLAFVLTGCKVGRDYVPPEPDLPATWTTGDGEPVALAGWWRAFGDPCLEGLVASALEANRDLMVAAQRVREARAGVRVVGGDARPTGDLGAGAARRKPSTSVAGGEFLPDDDAAFHSLGVQLGWDLDLFGRTARAVEAAEAERDALVAASRGVLVAVVTETAEAYARLRGAEAESALVQRSVAALRDTRGLLAARVAAGLEDELAVLRVDGLIATAEARLPDLEVRRARAWSALALLTGTPPQELVLEPSEGGPPEPPAAIASGAPVDLVRRRADLRMAEREIAQASARNAEAVARLFPDVSLGVAFGFESERSGDLFQGASQAWNAGASLLTPLFHGGILRAAITARDAQERQAWLRYEQAVLRALGEVEDALVGWREAERRRVARDAARAAEARAEALAEDRYEAGLAS